MSPSAPATFPLPPETHTASGQWRRVGYELEFTGLDIDQVLAVFAQALPGEQTRHSLVQATVANELGDFEVELDWNYLKQQAREPVNTDWDQNWLEFLEAAASIVVPVEVVCPPVPLHQQAALTPMITALREAGARGTSDSPIAAFGVHVNPEIPRRDAATLTRYLQAFCLLQWWLVDAHSIDFSRRVTSFIDLYPEAYLLRVARYETPDLAQLRRDYLRYNPTRNRALDLLPLLADFDESAIRAELDDVRIKPRPTFHYRLPDCHLERPGWSLADAWGTWLVVERLAAAPTLLNELRRAFLDRERPVLGLHRKQWTEFVAQWLNDHSLA